MTARIFVMVALCVGMTAFGREGRATAAEGEGAVYALTNESSGNAVAIFKRASNGTLTAAGTVATGGTGTGAGLGSQGALVLSRHRKQLYAVNAGSNDISVFKVTPDGLRLLNRAGSGGIQPISLTIFEDMLFVLNAGGSGNITGFHVGDNGKLRPLMNSTRPLSGPAVGPAQVQFSHDGRLLAVTEKATNIIDIYHVYKHGMVSGPLAQPSAGQTPFGFAFDRNDRLIVSEAFGGAAGAGAVSSYAVSRDGMIRVLTGSAPNYQGAPCWVILSENGRFAFVANTGSGTVSAYRIRTNGTLRLLDPDGVAGVTGDDTRPADMGLSDDGRYLYARNGGTGTISVFRVQHDGSLKHLGETGMLPAGAAGLAAH
jgi:6-phosphogluconolactonase (cycloisomerase 2 family)